MQTAHSTKHPNYLGVAILLGLITVGELVLASVFPTAAWKVPMLILLSIAKGALVALYYMHLRFDSRVYSFFFAFAIFVLAVPFIFVMLFLFEGGQLTR